MKSFYLWLAFLSLFALGLVDSGRGPVFPDLLKEFNLTDSQGAWFFALSSGFGFLNNFSATLWLARVGVYRAFQVYLGLLMVASVVIGLSQSYAMTLIGSALLGIAMGGLGITQNILVGQTAAPSSRRKAFSLLHCMYGAASLTAPLLISAVYFAGFSWRTTFLFLVLPTLVLLGTTLIRPAASIPAPQEEHRAKLKPGERGIVLTFALAVGLYVLSEILVSSRLVLYMRRELGYDVVSANSYLAWFFGLMLLGRALPMIFPAKITNMSVMRVSAALSFVLVILGIWGHPLWLAASGFTMAPFFPAAMTYIQEEFGAIRTVTFTWVFAAHSLGPMLMHWLTGVLADHFGLRFALGIGPSALGVVTILMLFVVRKPTN